MVCNGDVRSDFRRMKDTVSLLISLVYLFYSPFLTQFNGLFSIFVSKSIFNLMVCNGFIKSVFSSLEKLVENVLLSCTLAHVTAIPGLLISFHFNGLQYEIPFSALEEQKFCVHVY